MDFGFTSVAAITIICYLIAMGIKATKLDNKWIPVICGGLGGVLGLVAMFAMPTFPGTDYLSSFAIGVVSGFAATGVNQAAKQLGSGGDQGAKPSDSGGDPA